MVLLVDNEERTIDLYLTNSSESKINGFRAHTWNRTKDLCLIRTAFYH